MLKDNWMCGAITALALTLVLAQAAQAQKFNVIHNFAGGSDGANPWSGVTIDGRGNLYGTTFYGGAGYGTVFELQRVGSQFRFNPLYYFAGGTDGAYPWARVIIGADGALYGSAAAGGGGSCSFKQEFPGCGIVFRLRPGPPCLGCRRRWIETVLHRFSGASDGAFPQGDLAFDKSGNLYGATYEGGAVDSGIVYELTPSNGAWIESVLYQVMNGGDGSLPLGGVTFDTSGKLYGVFSATAPYGYGAGAVYQLSSSGSGWTEHTVYRFEDGNDGGAPMGGVIFDQSGNLYGTASNAGPASGGTAFEVSPSGGGWSYTLLYGFAGTCIECGSLDRLVMDAAGNFYGTTWHDGMYNKGSVFKLTPSNGGWVYTSLHDFTGGSDGAYPYGNVVFDANGNLYGTTDYGGANKYYGVVFEITP